MVTLAPLSLTQAEVLMPDGLRRVPVHLDGAIIGDRPGRPVDLSGYLIVPGIIDLHGDGFERHLAPRRGAIQSPGIGLTSLDAELAACGITTAVLAQFFSWEGGMRGGDFAEAVADAVAGFDALTDLRVQLRLETHLIDDYDRVLRLIDRAGIGYVVFNDHLPHDALAAGKRPPRLTGQALKSGRSPEAHLAFLHALHARGPEVPDALSDLAAALRDRAVRLGSHDDASPERRTGLRRLGADIAEFPETLSTAEAARAAGDKIIMGAPNVVRGGSHAGKVSARDLIGAGLVDALVSDYHYPALARAAFALVADGLPLSEAWTLISTGPASVMGWHDRGRIEPGARADLVMIETATQTIRGTISGGQISHLNGPLATRFLGALA